MLRLITTPTIRLRAISLWQPWASLMALRAKMIETRHWIPGYRGWIAIHAAKKWNAELVDQSLAPRFRVALYPDWPACVLSGPEHLPRGAFVAVGWLDRVITTEDETARPAKDSDEYAFGNYAPERWMWVFDTIYKLKEPIPARGYQSLWTPDEHKEAIFAQLPAEALGGVAV